MANPPPIPRDDKEITLRLVLSHIQFHATRLDNRIDKEIASLRSEIRDFRNEFREFAHGVDELDDRVQDIESENLPKRMKRIEQKLAIAA